LQDEFPGVEPGPIVLALRTTADSVDESHECFQIPKLLGQLPIDINQIRNCTSTVDRFRDLLSASPTPTALVKNITAILPLSDDTRSQPWRGRVPIRVVHFPAMHMPSIQTEAARLTALLPVRHVTSRFKSKWGHPFSINEPQPNPLITCPSLDPHHRCSNREEGKRRYPAQMLVKERRTVSQGE
jgi:hypothetical protein